MPDPATLEQEFRKAVAGLPNYKRSIAHAYVSYLRAEIEKKDKEITELAGYIDMQSQTKEGL